MSKRFSRLTREAIRKLGPLQRITEHGITAERTRDGDVRYSVNMMVDGQRIHRVVGRESEGVTRRQCEDFIAAKRTEAREERLSLPKGRKTHLTFEKAATDYLQGQEEGGGRNLVAKRRHMRMYLVPFFGSQRLKAITSFTLDRYKRGRGQAGASAGTINRELTTLSHLFRQAVKRNWIDKPPCPIERLQESEGRIIALTDEQADRLLQGAMDDEDSYCWLFVVFGLNTAMRHSEILRARFDQIDFDKLRLYVPQAKSGAREQPITEELSDILKAERATRADPNGWIFPTQRPSVTPNGHRTRLDRPFRRAVGRAGLDPKTVTPHVMRHTAITNLVKAGIDLPTIQRISGHKTLSMVLRYEHVHGDHIDKAIAAIGRGIPKPNRNKTTDAVTPELHIV